MDRKPEQSSTVLIVIGVFKLLKAFSLILIGLAVHHLLSGDTAEILTRWAHHIRIDPNNRHIHGFISSATGISRRKLEALSIGTWIYAAIFLTEGIGLLLRKRWAEYFTTISTAGLLPLEIYELVIHPRPVKAVILIANVAIVIYLIVRLGRTRSGRDAGTSTSLTNEPA